MLITGNEVYYGRIKDAFAPVITSKIHAVGGEIVGVYYAPDDESFIEARLKELINAGADLLIITGGMSVDPDDVTRFAVRNLGATDITYGSAVLPGAMFLVAYLDHGWSAFNPYPGNPCMRYVCKENDLRPDPSQGSCRREDWKKRTCRTRTRRFMYELRSLQVSGLPFWEG